VNRRKTIALLGGTAVAWPLAVRAQQPAMPLIGFLCGGSSEAYVRVLLSLRQGLKEFGFVEGQNVAFEYRFAEGQYDRLPAMAAELVHRPVAVIMAAGGTPSARAAKSATATIPIVFPDVAGNPVELGLVASLNRPGGNLTGVTTLNVEVGPKRLELLHAVVPTATIAALLVNPKGANTETASKYAQAAARSLGLQLHVLRASTEQDFGTVFATLGQLRVGGLVISNDPFFFSRSEQLAALTARNAVPTIYSFREFAAAGGLMSYGGNRDDAYRQAGVYIGRILKGESPGDLPVQQATKVELIINLKTAKALGLTIPISLLGRADEVIE
jgi:putative ABC transport system substrate-binding protein